MRLARCGHNRTGWYDFSIPLFLRRCYRKQSLRLFFFLSLSSCLSALSLPIRMSFTSSCRPSGSRGTSPVTQTVTSWNLPSRIKVSWPYLLLPSFLQPTLPDLRASLFRHGTFYCPSLSSRSTENMPVPVELGDVRLGERQPNEFIQ